jgi:polar amino acid transport system substrate-binding protein
MPLHRAHLYEVCSAHPAVKGLAALGAVSLLTCLGLFGCDELPRDPNDTAARVMSSGLRAGAVANPPWVEHGRRAAGLEVELIERFARELGTHVRWRLGSEQELMPALEAFELDLVIGGLRENNPHLVHVAKSRPYGEAFAERALVVAAAPGENRFLFELDAFLHAHAERALRARTRAAVATGRAAESSP